MSAVVIAASHLMPALAERLSGEGDLVTFADTEPIQALQAILERRPPLIVLERLFAATPRGAALINRIKTDPQLAHSEVRVMSHSGDYMRQVSRPAVAAAAGGVESRQGPAHSSVAAPAAPTESARPLDWHGTRRAARHRVRGGVEIQLDGNSAALLDISTVGAQVLSTTILRPNQKVRVSILNDETVLRFRGTIAWAKFELPKPTSPPVYRAGVEFIDQDAQSIDSYTARVKQAG